MTYKGKVEKGVVVLEKAGELPDGTAVEVVVARGRSRSRKKRSGWDELLRIAGSVKGLPRDMAHNHDHYIHGRPRR